MLKKTEGLVGMQELAEIATYDEEGFLSIETEDLLCADSLGGIYILFLNSVDFCQLSELRLLGQILRDAS